MDDKRTTVMKLANLEEKERKVRGSEKGEIIIDKKKRRTKEKIRKNNYIKQRNEKNNRSVKHS